MDTKLQVISGSLRGHKLSLPASARPTQNRARLAVFNMLDGILDFSRPLVAWDAFAGSGALGIEFLSKYNDSRVIFTDLSTDTTKIILKNLASVNDGRFVVSCADAIACIKKYAPDSDVVFVDPPYENSDLGIRFVKKFGDVARPGTIVVQELEDGVDFVPDAAVWNVLRDKKYGRARFLIMMHR